MIVVAMVIKFLLAVLIVATVNADHPDPKENVGYEEGGHDDYKEPKKAYRFGYDIVDDEKMQHHYEHSDGSGVVKGVYGYIDHKGIRRVVEYVADEHGFHANVKTNEQGMETSHPADAPVYKDDIIVPRPKYIQPNEQHGANQNEEYDSSSHEKHQDLH